MRTWSLRGGVFLLLLMLGWGIGTALRHGRHEGWSPHHKKLRVLTTIFPLYDFARTVGGDAVEVRNLLPPGVDPHEFALSPGDISTVAEADVLIANGAGLDDFLTDALKKAEISGKPVIHCAEGLPLLSVGEGEPHAGHKEGDPHLWLDPQNARHYVKVISEAVHSALVKQGRSREAEAVSARTAAFDAQLAALDADFMAQLKGVKRRSFIAFHGAFAYLAARYNLKVAAVWQPSPGREPAPRDVGRILALAKDQDVGALFTEPQFSPRAIEMIAADAKVPVYSLDPLETAEDFNRTHYLDVMRANLHTLVTALGGTKRD